MPRGTGIQTKVHYQGKDNDYIVFVDDSETLKKWKTDSSIPLAQVVGNFKVFETGKQGAQGVLSAASNAQLENEFGTKEQEECIKQILNKGTLQETEGAERQGPKNDSKGPMAAH